MANRSSKVRLKPDPTYVGTQGARSTKRYRSFAFLAVFALIVVAAAAVFASIVVTAQEPDRARTEAASRRATERLIALQHEADRLASEERTLLGDLRKLEIQR